MRPYQSALRDLLARRVAAPFVGVFDMLSASAVADQTDALFVGGFGFSAARYGLPDRGAISWRDLVELVGQLRLHLPGHHVVVDVDDGYGDPVVAVRAAVELEAAGASGIVLEDQARPRAYGQVPRRTIVPAARYLDMVTSVRAAVDGLVVIARTDAAAGEEAHERVAAYARAKPDGVLVKQVAGREDLAALCAAAGDVPLVLDRVPGGPVPELARAALGTLGVGAVLYSTDAVLGALDGVRARVAAALGETGTPGPGASSPEDLLAMLDQYLVPGAPRRERTPSA